MSNKSTIVLISIIAVIAILTAVFVILALDQKVGQNPNNIENNIVEERNIVDDDNIGKNTVDDDTDEEEQLAIANKGEITTQRATYKDAHNKRAVVPQGYAVINDSPNISEGLVISDVPGDDLENSKGGNQFVWIPVDTPVLDVSQFGDETDINDAISESVEKREYPMAIKLANGNYKGVLYRFEAINEKTAIKVNFIAYSENATEREPLNLDENNSLVEGWTQDLYQIEYNELVKRVKKDKGFWVARYETSVNSSNMAQSKKNEKVMTNVSWYNLYSVQKSLTKENTKSHMIWGSQWDQIMIWIKDIKNISGKGSYRYFILDSTNMGNYLNTEIKDDRITIKKAGEAFRFKAGELEGTKVNNIYDLAGNAWEWTMEANFSTLRTVRGGDCTYDGAIYPASVRFSFKPTYKDEKLENIGSRMTIY